MLMVIFKRRGTLGPFKNKQQVKNPKNHGSNY